MMIKKILLFVGTLFLSSVLFAQSLDDKIDLKNFQHEFFTKVLVEKVNKMRDSLGKAPITVSTILGESAAQHAKFLSKAKRVTHYQKKKKYKDAPSRAKAFGAKKDFVWENMMACSIHKPTYITYKKGSKKTTIKTYKQLLKFLWEGFMASQTNIDNITSERVKETGISFFIDTKKQKFFLVQVFSN
ncbi:MAG: CAP domain-containing protein [Cytophagales bacterium]|nr:CAP domain-containing protein [Cytophagales bacterium]